MNLDFLIQSSVNPDTGLTEKIILKGFTTEVSNEGKSYITIHYVYETLSNGITITKTNGGYRLDEGGVSTSKSGKILTQLGENGDPMLDEDGNEIPRTDACSKFITLLYNGFFNVLKSGIIEYENN